MFPIARVMTSAMRLMSAKFEKGLGWVPKETFEARLRETAQWYPDYVAGCQYVQNGGDKRRRLGVIDDN
jgi:dTDP-D-glucose 4,6-dehydratase